MLCRTPKLINEKRWRSQPQIIFMAAIQQKAYKYITYYIWSQQTHQTLLSIQSCFEKTKSIQQWILSGAGSVSHRPMGFLDGLRINYGRMNELNHSLWLSILNSQYHILIIFAIVFIAVVAQPEPDHTVSYARSTNFFFVVCILRLSFDDFVVFPLIQYALNRSDIIMWASACSSVQCLSADAPVQPSGNISKYRNARKLEISLKQQ